MNRTVNNLITAASPQKAGGMFLHVIGRFVPELLLLTIPVITAWLGGQAFRSGAWYYANRNTHNRILCHVGGFLTSILGGLGLGVAAVYAAYHYFAHWLVIVPIIVWLWTSFSEDLLTVLNEIRYQKEKSHIV